MGAVDAAARSPGPEAMCLEGGKGSNINKQPLAVFCRQEDPSIKDPWQVSLREARSGYAGEVATQSQHLQARAQHCEPGSNKAIISMQAGESHCKIIPYTVQYE